VLTNRSSWVLYSLCSFALQRLEVEGRSEEDRSVMLMLVEQPVTANS